MMAARPKIKFLTLLKSAITTAISDKAEFGQYSTGNFIHLHSTHQTPVVGDKRERVRPWFGSSVWKSVSNLRLAAASSETSNIQARDRFGFGGDANQQGKKLLPFFALPPGFRSVRTTHNRQVEAGRPAR